MSSITYLFDNSNNRQQARPHSKSGATRTTRGLLDRTPPPAAAAAPSRRSEGAPKGNPSRAAAAEYLVYTWSIVPGRFRPESEPETHLSNLQHQEEEYAAGGVADGPTNYRAGNHR